MAPALEVWWREWRWFLFGTSLIFIVLCAGVLWGDAVWGPLAVGSMPPAFGDMEAVLAAGDAWGAGRDPYAVPNVFDSYGRPHIYGPGWLLTSQLGISIADLATAGVVTLTAFFVAVSRWCRPTSWRGALGMLAAFLSPPILLGLERANNDLVIAALFSLCAVLVGRRQATVNWAVVVLLAVAAWLKLYPIYAAMALLTLSGGLRAQVLRIVGWVALTAGGFAVYWGAYATLWKNIPGANSVFSYELRYALGVCWKGAYGLREWFWAGSLAALVTVGVIFRTGFRGLWGWLPQSGPWAFLVVGSAAIWMGCMCSAPSYPYRAIWLLPLVGWAVHRDSADRNRATSRGVLVWVISFLWIYALQWHVFRLYETGRLIGLRGWSLTVAFAQASVVITTALVAWMLLGWIWRRVRALLFSASADREGLAASTTGRPVGAQK